MLGIEREQPWTSGRLAPHRQHSRIIGVEDIPPVRAGNTGDGGLDLCQLVDGADAELVEVVLGYVRYHGDIVVIGADAAEQDPTPCRLEHGEVDARLRQRLRRPAEP